MSAVPLKRWIVEVMLPECFSDGGGYWKKIFTDESAAEWTADSPALLIFDLGVDPATAKTEPHPTDKEARRIVGGQLVPIALVNEPLEFWDAVFSCFVVFGHRLWKTPKQLAKSVKRSMTKWGWPPQAYQNMNARHFAWIQDLVQGRERLRFLDEPLKWTAVMDLKLFYRQLAEGKFPGLETGNAEADEKNREFVEKRIEKLASEFERLGGMFETPHPAELDEKNKI